MEKIDNKKVAFPVTNKLYTSKELERMKIIVKNVTIESEQKDQSSDFNDWGNHSEYTRGW